MALVREEQISSFKKETRRRKKVLLDNYKSHWLKKAQKEFNLYIRLRDKDDPCISCGRLIVEQTVGGQWDCGHYRSRGAIGALRFEPLNAHKQCKSCNGGSAKYSIKGETVRISYRTNLIQKIGIEKVEWLDGPHPDKKYTLEDYKNIFYHYQNINKSMASGEAENLGG